MPVDLASGDTEAMGLASLEEAGPSTPSTDADALERRGRKWLIWSFVFCPCHLPFTMAGLAILLGGTAAGTFISHNTIGVGVVAGAIYLVGVGIGFRHIRAANAGRNCSTGSCEI